MLTSIYVKYWNGLTRLRCDSDTLRYIISETSAHGKSGHFHLLQPYPSWPHLGAALRMVKEGTYPATLFDDTLFFIKAVWLVVTAQLLGFTFYIYDDGTRVAGVGRNYLGATSQNYGTCRPWKLAVRNIVLNILIDFEEAVPEDHPELFVRVINHSRMLSVISFDLLRFVNMSVVLVDLGR